jgi:hypothetical protein
MTTATPKVGHSLTWLALAAAIGFLVPAVFSTGLRWERSLFLVPYVAIVGGFLAAYFRRVPMSVRQFAGDWRYALVGVAAASVLLLRNIYGQPSSEVPQGFQLVVALLWIGLTYGVVDGLFLNVMPVLAVQGAAFPGSSRSKRERLLRGLLALAASIFVTVAYHSGYTEFHGAKMLSVIVGNVIITSGYLLTGSPLAAVATHLVMHVAAVLHGMETTLQLPPHYLP